jgi:hypothetical protein
VSIQVIGIRGAFGGANERLRLASLAAAAQMAEEGARFIKEAMRAEGKTDTDLTVQAVKAQPATVVQPGVARAMVTVAAQQAAPAIVLEDGRKPGKGVSRIGMDKLAVWARRKARGMVDQVRAQMERDAVHRSGGERLSKVMGKAADRQKAAEKRVAYMIASAIKRRGLKPFRFFRRARHHVQNQAMAIFRRVLARLPRRVGT